MERLSFEVQKQIQKRVEMTLRNNKIIVFGLEDEELFEMLCSKIANEKLAVKVWSHFSCNDCNQVETLSEEEFQEFMKLYFLYEFSDRLTILSVNNQYADLMNYMSTGILTKEQVIEAILYQ